MPHAGFHACEQLLEDDPRDRRHIKMSGFLDRHPDELNQFGVRADNALDRVGDGGSVRRQKACVKTAGAPRWRDRARDEMNLPEVRVNVRLREFRPDLAWDFRRTVTFDAQ